MNKEAPNLLLGKEAAEAIEKRKDKQELTRGQCLILVQKSLDALVEERDEALDYANERQRRIVGIQRLWAEMCSVEATEEFVVRYYQTRITSMNEEGEVVEETGINWTARNRGKAGFLKDD